jgi:hypothetical protein
MVAALGGLALLGLVWRPLLLALVPLAGAVLLVVLYAWSGAARATFARSYTPRERLALRVRIGFLYLSQPLARLRGRLLLGLTPWRLRTAGLALPLTRTSALWTESWQDLDQRLRDVEATLRAAGAPTRRGGDYEPWDLEVRGGLLGAARLVAAAEDHGGGAQLVRFRWWPRCSYGAIVVVTLFAAIAAAALLAHAWIAGVLLGGLAATLALRLVIECGAASVSLSHALTRSTNEGA